MGVADTHTSPLLLKEPGGWIQSSFSIFFCTQRYLMPILGTLGPLDIYMGLADLTQDPG